MSENGVDIGSMYQILVALSGKIGQIEVDLAQMKAELGQMKSAMVTKGDLTAMVTKADLAAMRDELRSEIRGYHAAVMGHGILISELDERVTRLEDHTGLHRTT
jgi:capsule polysaccharide export protein KpsE/RkpR